MLLYYAFNCWPYIWLKSIFNIMFSISVIKCFVITIIIVFSCLSSIASKNIIQSNAIHSEDSIKPLISSSSNSHSIHLYGANNANSGRITSSSVDKGSCTESSVCPHHSFCDSQNHRCKCREDFVEINKFMNGTISQSSVVICLPVAKLDERCDSHEQCLVTNSICSFVDQAHGMYKNVSSNYCKCREGFHTEDREEVIHTKDNQKILNRPICGEFASIGNSWIGTFAIVCIMLLIILIGCFVGIIRFQRWKQRPMASTVTSLAQQGHQQHMMSSSPPPMGSVEAEFQNDFIQVFPMHHLEPLPDKNTAHQYEYVIK